jgi:hypothetical protein
MMKKTPKNLELLEKQAIEALKEAVLLTIKDHAKTGDPIIIYKNGKVARVSAKRYAGLGNRKNKARPTKKRR